MRWGRALALAGAAVVLVRRTWLVVTVRGGSMLPALREGDVLLASRVRRARVRDVVVLADPYGEGLLVKRVAALAGDPWPGAGRVPPRTVVVLGDNGGLDSRMFGPVPLDRLRGVVVRRVRHATSGGRDYVLLADPAADPLLRHRPTVR